MIRTLTFAAAVAALASGVAFADEKKSPTAQQGRMANCNKEAGAKRLEGEARKAFMRTCLKA